MYMNICNNGKFYEGEIYGVTGDFYRYEIENLT